MRCPSTAEQLHLDPEQVYACLSRTAPGPERLDQVVPDGPMFTRLPFMVVAEALAVYSPQEGR